MPLAASDIATRLSTTAGSAGNSTAQSDPNASLGKYISTTALGTSLHDLFDAVSGSENAAQQVEYRCVFIANTHGSATLANAVVWLTQGSSGAEIRVAVDNLAASALGSASAQAAQIATETTTPSGVGTFGRHPSQAQGLAIGSIGPGQCRAIWLRRRARASTIARNNSATLNIAGSGQENLTVSGNEITDAVRATGTTGDGRTSDSSFGIWRAATNLENSAGADVSFETATTGYTTGGTNTIASSAEQAKFGTRSCKATYQDNALLLDIALTLTAAAHSTSRWVYIPTNYDGGGVRVQFANYAGATGTLFADANMALRDQWQRVGIPNVGIVAGDLVGNVQVVNTGAAPTAGRALYIDGCQTEAAPIVTPFTISPRSAARVQIPITPLITTTQFWVAMRARMGVPSTSVPDFMRLFSWIDTLGHGVEIIVHTLTTGNWVTDRKDGGVGGIIQTLGLTWVAGDQITIISTGTAAEISISGNGVAFRTLGNTALPSVVATLADLGRQRTSAAGYMNGDLRCAAFGTGTLSNADAATLHTLLSAGDPTPEQINAAIPAAVCTAVWPADTAAYLTPAVSLNRLVRWDVDGPYPPLGGSIRVGESRSGSLRVGESRSGTIRVGE
jgi:hypothetical protein